MSGKGAAVVDPVKSTLDVSLQALAPEGRLIFVGSAGGGALASDLWPAMQAKQSLLGISMGTQFTYKRSAVTVNRIAR